MPWIELVPQVFLEPGPHPGWRALLSLAPVLLFLALLTGLDSFRLVRPSRVARALGFGAAAALVVYVVNTFLLEISGLQPGTFAVLVSPLVEEAGKGAWVAREVKLGRVGFLIDAAILGFGVGAGFALVENVYYLHALGDMPLLVWGVRGLGTALMHGGATALLAVILSGRPGGARLAPPWLYGIVLATLIHATFNRWMTAPLPATALLLAVLAGSMFVLYRQGERRLRAWLGRGFDRDSELLALINSGRVQDSPLGRYLESLKEGFRPDVVADMLCLLRLQVELSLRAKGTLILREQGLAPAPDPDLPAKLAELRFLEGRIGRAGRLAMRPICHWRDADHWQAYLLEEGARD